MNINKEKFYEGFSPFYKSVTGKKIVSQSVIGAVDFLLHSFQTNSQWKTVPQVAYALATVLHETAYTFKPITEYGGKSYFNKYNAGTRIGSNLGNTEVGDGYAFRGRGYVQITGRRNYTKYGIADTPDLALDPVTAFRIMTEGMFKGGFTGKKLTDYVNNSSKDYKNARRVINGTDKAATIASYASKLEAILSASTNVHAAPVIEDKPIVVKEDSNVIEPVPSVDVEVPVDGYPEDPKPGEAIPDDAAKAGAPVVGGRPGDPSIEITAGTPQETSGWGAWVANIRAQWVALGLGIPSLGGLTFLTNPIFWWIAGGVLGLAIIISATAYITAMVVKSKEKREREQRQHEIDLKEMELAADPTKYNVTLKRK